MSQADARFYDASSIRILPDAEIVERFTGALAAEFGVPVDWVGRGLEACERAGVPEDYFIGLREARDANSRAATRERGA